MTHRRFPNKAFEYLEKHSIIKGIYRYIIDHRYRKAYKLHKWIEPQVSNAPKELKDLAKHITKAYSKDNYDSKMVMLLRWIKRNMRYNGDHKVWKTNEYWQTALETATYWYIKEGTDIKLVAQNKLNNPGIKGCFRSGDCEDGAILLYVLARLAGIPANRLLLTCGSVNGGGHCWLSYRPSTDPYNLCFIDWCYWYDGTGVSTRKRYWIVGKDIRGDKNKYYNVWFLFNEKSTYLEFKPTYI